MPGLKVIYVVNDEPLALHAIGRILSRPGWSIRLFADPTEALAGTANLQPDLVITDLDMPEMDGCRLLREVHRRHPAVRTILCSQRDMPAEARRAQREGAIDALCATPCGNGLFIHMVRQLLGEAPESTYALAG